MPVDKDPNTEKDTDFIAPETGLASDDQELSETSEAEKIQLEVEAACKPHLAKMRQIFEAFGVQPSFVDGGRDADFGDDIQTHLAEEQAQVEPTKALVSKHFLSRKHLPQGGSLTAFTEVRDAENGLQNVSVALEESGHIYNRQESNVPISVKYYSAVYMTEAERSAIDGYLSYSRENNDDILVVDVERELNALMCKVDLLEKSKSDPDIKKYVEFLESEGVEPMDGFEYSRALQHYPEIKDDPELTDKLIELVRLRAKRGNSEIYDQTAEMQGRLCAYICALVSARMKYLCEIAGNGDPRFTLVKERDNGFKSYELADDFVFSEDDATAAREKYLAWLKATEGEEDNDGQEDSSATLRRLEGELTPEDLEIITAKLEQLADPEKEVAIRFVNSAEYFSTLADPENSHIRGSIEFNIDTVGHIRKVLQADISHGSFGVWGEYAADMTSTPYGVADLIRNYNLFLKRYRGLSKESRTQESEESGRRQFILELKNYLANFIDIYHYYRTFQDDLYYKTPEQKAASDRSHQAGEANREYLGRLSDTYIKNFFNRGETTKSEQYLNPTEVDKKVSTAVGKLEGIPMDKPNLTFTEEEKANFIDILQKDSDDMTSDDLRTLMGYARNWKSMSGAESGMFLPYDLLVIMDTKAVPEHRSLAGWRLSQEEGDTKHILGVVSLISDKRLYARVAEAMLATQKHDFFHPILNPRGETVFPGGGVIGAAKDKKEADRIRQEIATKEEVARQETATESRENNVFEWEKRAQELNSKRSRVDKLFQRNIVTWQDVAREDAQKADNEDTHN